MNSISTLNSGLENFLRQQFDGLVDSNEKYSSGDYYEAIRNGVPSTVRKNNGIYFTDIQVAKDLLGLAKLDWSKVKKVYDPACGSGELLVAAAEMLPVFNDLKSTLFFWGKILYGSDLHPELVRTTKLRLVLLAIDKNSNKKGITFTEALSLFNNIKVRDSLVEDAEFGGCDLIVMNPPFSKETQYSSSLKIKGHVNASMLFLERAIRFIGDGEIVAILPDVLRSGTRYRYFREWANDNIIGEITSKGRFDRYTDVDVFFLRAKCRNQSIEDKTPFKTENKLVSKKVSDFFDVRVGPVVPHRSPQDGPVVPFIHARSVLPWKENNNICERRAFSGTLYLPPFIVLRRTSSPSDKNRAVAAIIQGNEPVAVENHLIVLKPNCPEIDLDELLLRYFRSDIVNDFLNENIRCRHLTTAIVKDIPFYMESVNGDTG